MARYFMIQLETVINVIVWNGSDPLTLDDGVTLEPAVDAVDRGWVRVDGVWTAPPPEEEGTE